MDKNINMELAGSKIMKIFKEHGMGCEDQVGVLCCLLMSINYVCCDFDHDHRKNVIDKLRRTFMDEFPEIFSTIVNDESTSKH